MQSVVMYDCFVANNKRLHLLIQMGDAVFPHKTMYKNVTLLCGIYFCKSLRFFYYVIDFFCLLSNKTHSNTHTICPLFIVWYCGGEKTLKYKKCPRCQLNYIAEDWNICSVCQNEIDGKKSIFDEESDVLLCPCCHKHELGLDEVVCVHCQRKRYKHFDE